MITPDHLPHFAITCHFYPGSQNQCPLKSDKDKFYASTRTHSTCNHSQDSSVQLPNTLLLGTQTLSLGPSKMNFMTKSFLKPFRYTLGPTTVHQTRKTFLACTIPCLGQKVSYLPQNHRTLPRPPNLCTKPNLCPYSMVRSGSIFYMSNQSLLFTWHLSPKAISKL